MCGHGRRGSYWAANMELIDMVPVFDLYDEFWKIYTKSEIIRPQYIADSATINRAMSWTYAQMTRRQMEVNYFGTINAAQPCLTRMRGQSKGLLIVIGSIAGRVSIPMQSQYSASKYALEAFTDAVRMEMKKYGVRACIIEPGDTKTGFTAARVTQDASGAEGYGSVLRKSVAKMATDEQNGRSPESVAKVALALAGRKDPPARVPVGMDYKALMLLLRVMPDRAKELILSKLYLPKE